MANHVWSDKHQCSSVLFGEQLLSEEVGKSENCYHQSIWKEMVITEIWVDGSSEQSVFNYK